MTKDRPVFHKVLIANRGEIARRIMRTCRDLGIATVAVYSDADADEPHVHEADEAVRLGPPPAAESYLDIERLVAAGRRIGAEAVHPGYGFLAENADFAAACGEAGLVFVGPRPETIRLMGDKAAAKRRLEAAGVPVIPGVDGEDLDPAALSEAAGSVGYPVLVKAVAGGGGKGMRQVARADDLDEAIAAARREARSAFGDDRVLIEKVVERPRHVEFQVLGDATGNVVHVFERECSIQRRHQKVVEETPSPALDDDLRRDMGAAAVAAAEAVGYLGAGTVEMLLSDTTGDFYFLEMNTRLQVEHPVTELVTGLDLVALQFQIAAGGALPFEQDDLRTTGHAIEARVYAEDAATDFLPQTGRVLAYHPPDAGDVRVDSGIATGSLVSPHYDPMLAKIVVHGEDRQTAAARLAWALRHTAVLGVVTNVEFLTDVVTHPAFLDGALTTGFIDEHLPDWRRPSPSPELLAAAGAALMDGAHAPPAAWSSDPWSRLGPWRTAGVGGWHLRLEDENGDEHDIVVVGRHTDLSIRVDGVDARASRWRQGHVDVHVEDRSVPAVAAVVPPEEAGRATGQQVWTHVPGHTARLRVHPPTRHVDAAVAAAGDVHASPMPGTVAAVNVAEGDEVTAGALLVVVEAMKMEHPVRAPAPSVVTAVHVEVGDAVDADEPLVELEPRDAPT